MMLEAETMPEPTDLLADLHQLRARARDDRHGYAFSLLLFGVLILAAPLLYASAVREGDPYDTYDPKPTGSNPLVQIFRTSAGPDPEHPTLIAWYWLGALVVGFGATVWWYRRRAARVGVETDTRAFLIAAAAGFAGFFLGTYPFSRYALSLYGAWQWNLSLMFGSLLLGALALWWSRGPVGVFLASLCGAVTFSSIAVYTDKGFSALLVIAAGLLALAWLERSVLLGVVSALFTLAAIPATTMINVPLGPVDPAGLFWHLGWHGDYTDTRLYALQQLLLPAAVLLVGGGVAAVRARR
jgi:hypothetical protein